MKINLGKALPLLVLALALMDFFLRFLPTSLFTYRSWEAVTRYSYKFGAFQPNQNYYTSTSYGDLSTMGNLPSFRVFKEESFHSDSCGFRNETAVNNGSGSTDVLLLGSSFMASAGVSDRQSITSQLHTLSGLTIYNAAGKDVDKNWVLALARNIQLKPGGTIVLEYMDRFNVNPHYLMGGESSNTEFNSKTLCTTEHLSLLWRGFWRVSPLKILGQTFIKKLQNNIILPNPFNHVVVQTLVNNEQMLFFDDDIEKYHAQRDIETPVHAWKSFQDAIETAGYRSIILLIPSKYSTYYPLLKNQRPKASSEYFSDLENRLHQEGIKFINLQHPFRMEAASQLKKNSFIFWKDDTHWNAQGIAIASSYLSEYLKKQ